MKYMSIILKSYCAIKEKTSPMVLAVMLTFLSAFACNTGTAAKFDTDASGSSTDEDEPKEGSDTLDDNDGRDDDNGTNDVADPKETDEDEAPNDTAEQDGEAVIAEPSDEAAYLFSPDVVRTYELRLSNQNLAFLDADPAKEEYVEGELVFEDQTIGPVGIRYKGSAGAFSGCTGGNMGGFGSTAKTCPKMSMKVKFNWKDPDALFYGVRKLQFHAMNSDDSLMREQLGYRTFRAMGIAAPRTAYVRLLINGQLEGVFLLVEQIDGRFTRSRFGEGGKGNLYKEVWPVHLRANPYRKALRTNEDEDPSFARPMALASELKDANRDAREAIVARWMDIDYTLRYVAVDRVIKHDDGPFHWYCGIQIAQGNNPGTCGNHNYYWYEAMKTDRFWIIAWDLDLAFGGNETITLTDAWNNRGPSCNVPTFGMFGQRPAACDPLIYAWGGMTDPYQQAIDELVSGPFSAKVVDELLNKWEAQVRSAVVEAAKRQGHLQVNAWQAALSELKRAINRQRTQLSTS